MPGTSTSILKTKKGNVNGLMPYMWSHFLKFQAMVDVWCEEALMACGEFCRPLIAAGDGQTVPRGQ